MVKLIQWKLRLLVVHVGWGNVRDRRALLGGTVWQRDGAARRAEGHRRSGEVVVAVVWSSVTASKRAILHVSEVTLPLSSGISLLSMVALQGVGSMCWARRARPVILRRWVLDRLSLSRVVGSGFNWPRGSAVAPQFVGLIRP